MWVVGVGRVGCEGGEKWVVEVGRVDCRDGVGRGGEGVLWRRRGWVMKVGKVGCGGGEGGMVGQSGLWRWGRAGWAVPSILAQGGPAQPSLTS